MFAAGVLHGGREAYHADPNVFEKHWGVGSNSFFGSASWTRKYYTNSNGALVEKPLFGTTFSDFWHSSQFVGRGLVIGGTLTYSLYKPSSPKKWYHTAIIAAGSFAAYTAGAAITYNLLRY